MKNKIGFYPENRLRKENTYFSTISKCLQDIGWQVVDYREIYKDPEISVVDLNFFENVTAANSFLAFLKFLKRVFIFIYIKLSGRKVIFTMHNKIAHDTRHPVLSNCLIRMQIKYADAIVGLCSETENIIKDYNSDAKIVKKLYIIPHPKYIFANEFEARSCGGRGNSMKVLFVGQIRKYKNVEYILRLAREHEKDAVDFLVAGKVESETYKSELIESAQGLSNIKFLFGYLDESDMANLILRSDLLITPYNKVSSLNSGTIFLAFTLGTTCVCPNIGSAMDVHNKNAFYMYEYNAEEDHYVNLNAMFCNALEDYKSGALQKKGKLCVQEVNLYNSLEKVKSGYEKLLRKITS